MKRTSLGFSLIELMTAITIGMLILIGLSSVFVNSSTASKELKNTSEQIENGRYAIELLSQDIRHAGFYGELSTLPATPASADPCAAPTDGAVSDTANAYLALAVQRVIGGTDCTTPLSAANLQANSDIIAVRRTDTTRLPVSCTTTGTVENNVYYLQTTPNGAEFQKGVASANPIDSTKNATGAAYTTLMVRRDTTVAAGSLATGTCAAAGAGLFPEVAASIRKYRAHIYFVAPCSVPSDGTTICTGATDDNGKPIPTLKRLEMGANGAFTIVPMVEGIEAIRFEYGTDTLPASADVNTGLIGDGVTDGYTNTASLTDAGNTISVRLYVLARNTTSTSGYVDDKTYTLGNSPSYTFTPTGAQTSYKRHVYSAEVRIVNQAGRREVPR